VQPGEVIGVAWGMYKAHWRHFVAIAFIVYLLVSLLVLLLAFLLGWLGALAAIFVTVAGVFWVQGALVVAVEDVRDGRADLSLTETLGHVRPHLNTLALAGLLASIGIFIGLLLLIVPGLYLLTIWSVIVPVIVLEGATVMSSFGRSRELVRGNGWNSFGVIVLTVLVLIAIAIVVELALFWLPKGVDYYVITVIRNSLSAPFAALAWTNMYYRLRDLRTAVPAAAV
jgi:hypothetical protein